MNNTALAGLVAGLLTAGACSAEREARKSSEADATSNSPASNLPPSLLSRIDVPLTYDFTAQLALVERAIPKAFGSIDSLRQLGDNARKHYAFEATRGPFTAYARGRDVYLRTVFTYRARAYYDPPIAPRMSAGCGSDKQEPALVVELVAPLTLGTDWHLRSRTRIAQVSPATESEIDRCRVSFLGLDMTAKVMEAARNAITGHLSDIDAKVAGIDLSRKATDWWNTLNKPIRLASDVWLTLNPVQLRLGTVRGNRQVMAVEAGLDAYPAIVMGREPPARVVPLPPLGKDTIANGFNVNVEGRVNYVAASRAFSRELNGKTVTQSGRSVIIRDVSASYGERGRVALEVSFSGDAQGALRLVGTPAFDVAREYIIVPDLDFDLATDNQLLNTFAWLKSSDLLLLMRNKARLPVAPALERGKELVLKGINRVIKNVVTLSGTVDSVSAVGLDVNARGLVVRGGVTGTAKVAVNPKR